MTLRVWLHVLIKLSKPIECTRPRVNPHVKCGLWVLMLVNVGLSVLTDEPLWWMMLIEEDSTCVGGRVCIGNLCVCHEFYYENKGALKNEVY